MKSLETWCDVVARYPPSSPTTVRDSATREAIRSTVAFLPWLHAPVSTPTAPRREHLRTIRDVMKYRLQHHCALPWEDESLRALWPLDDLLACGGSYLPSGLWRTTAANHTITTANYAPRPNYLPDKNTVADELSFVFLDLDGVILDDVVLPQDTPHGTAFAGLFPHEIVHSEKALDLNFKELTSHIPWEELEKMILTPCFLPTLYAWRLWIQPDRFLHLLQWQNEDPTIRFVIASHHNLVYDIRVLREILLYPLRIVGAIGERNISGIFEWVERYGVKSFVCLDDDERYFYHDGQEDNGLPLCFVKVDNMLDHAVVQQGKRRIKHVSRLQPHPQGWTRKELVHQMYFRFPFTVNDVKCGVQSVLMVLLVFSIVFSL